eukprot:TRINITY_DN5876_c0_g1_i1.p1 TRINITY_DN5876_c0_g1~~TRINITY_DN5876_c0_g1_i1.p1  ORF type:complete len:497 (+),score=58.55 TRINITY_DN5876_c0_g1_i1:57-1547(+)
MKLLAAWTFATASSNALNDEARPNILLLTTDQQRLDSLSCYGSTFAKSPNIDRLAREGVRFEESYTASPVCESARASWLTGTQASVHNVWGNGITMRRPWPSNNFIDPLRKAGYYTAMMGKTHFDPVPEFDYKDIHSGNSDKRKPNTPAADFLETYLVNQTMRLLDNQIPAANTIASGQPWFVHLSFISPHPPTNVPVEWQDVTFDNLPKLIYGGPDEIRSFPTQLRRLQGIFGEPNEIYAFPNGQANVSFIKEQRRQYYALTSYVDFQVGRMLDFLDERGLVNNTLVIFSSDHGTNLFDHGMAQKYSFFAGSWRVPLLMRGPGLPRHETRRFASGVDIPATILGAAGAQRLEGLNGFDFYTALRSGAASPRSGGVAASYMAGNAVVTSSWKFVYYMDDARGQLFNRETDPSELVNLFDSPEHSNIKNGLLMALLKWKAGLEPVAWLQGHVLPASSGDWGVDYNYTKSLTGLEPEQQLQSDLSSVVGASRELPWYL